MAGLNKKRRGARQFSGMIVKETFTIIELMIVISIIFILMGILLPSLKQVKNKARQINCLANLRQCSHGTYGYYGDFNSYIPFAYDTAGSPHSGYATSKNPAWYCLISEYLNVPQYSFDRLGLTDSGLYKAVVFSCPAQDFKYPSVYPVSYAPEIRSSGKAVDDVNGIRRARLDKILTPSKKAWLSESTSPYFINGSGIIPGGSNNLFGIRHSGSGNILFFDGHAMWMPFDEVRVPASGTYSSIYGL